MQRVQIIPDLNNLISAHLNDPQQTLHFILPSLMPEGIDLEILPIEDALPTNFGLVFQKGKYYLFAFIGHDDFIVILSHRFRIHSLI